MSDNKLTDGRGLYQLPDQPEPPPLQGSVSAPVSALGRADAPLRECPFCGGKADLHIDGLYNVVIECEGCHGVYTGWPLRSQLLQAWNRRDGEAARVAEAVAQERARIVAALEGDKLTPGETYKEDREHELYNDAIDDAIAIVRGSKQEDAP
jgi:hypothetical protein